LTTEELLKLIDPKDMVVSVTYSGQPLPKERPRFSAKGWAYTGQRTRYYERALSLLFKVQVGPGKVDSRSAFAVACRFFRSDRARVDVDNLLKSVLDAANGVVWADDSQVVEVRASLHKAQEEPRAEVVIYRLRDR
jgi:Holliday junction resolvase RusA-like endonuclease